MNKILLIVLSLFVYQTECGEKAEKPHFTQSGVIADKNFLETLAAAHFKATCVITKSTAQESERKKPQPSGNHSLRGDLEGFAVVSGAFVGCREVVKILSECCGEPEQHRDKTAKMVCIIVIGSLVAGTAYDTYFKKDSDRL